jgi:hypothetical protein
MPTRDPAESLYLTPRVVETARNVGVIAFSGSQTDMDGIYSLVAREVPECMPPHTSKDNLIFVARWVGRFGMERDIDLPHVAPDEPYLRASDYADYIPVRGHTEVNGWTTKRALDADTSKTLIDLTFSSWNWPDFGTRLAKALTPRVANMYDHDIMVAQAGLGYVDRRRNARIRASLEYPHPYSILRAPGRPYRKPPIGSDLIK